MKNKTTNLKVMTLLGAISCSHLAMAEQIFQHQGQPPQLIELYTSEDCSSCPPADKYLATFLQHPQLWKAVVPLAFHVDYWDYLGWADPFAQQQFKERQYNYRRHNHISSVYTPGWIINGKEWRGFSVGKTYQPTPHRNMALYTHNFRETNSTYAIREQVKICH